MPLSHCFSAAKAEERLETQQLRGSSVSFSGALVAAMPAFGDNEVGEFVVPLPAHVNRSSVNGLFAAIDLEGEFRTEPAESSWEGLEEEQDRLDRALSGLIGLGVVTR